MGIPLSSKIVKTWVHLSEIVIDPEYLEYLIERGYVSMPSDLYKLSIRILLDNYSISTPEASKILESITESKNVGLPRAALSLLPDSDPQLLADLVSKYLNIDDVIMSCTKSEYPDYLKEEVERLIQLGINLSFKDDTIFEELMSTPFMGKSMAISGTLSADNSVVKNALSSLGASVCSNVTDKTDFILIGENPGEELNTAIKLGVEVITEQDIERMLGIAP